MKTMERKFLRQRAGSFNIWDYDQLCISEIIEELKKLPQEAKLEVIRDCYSDDSELYIERIETDDEMNRRVETEKKESKIIEEREKIQLKMLKEKYEK